MATETPAVSVIIPVHNAQRFLLDTLENVLTQDLPNIEVVCVDDGSTDASAYIVRELARTDGRVRLVTQQQAGPGAARNRGIDEARGQFLTFLDADDWYEEPSYLSALYDGAVEHGQLVAGGCMVNWWGPDDQERDFADKLFFDGYEFTGERVVDWHDWQFDFGFTRFLFHRSFFEGGRNRFNGLTFFEDPPFLVKLLDEAGTFFATDRAHYVYRLDRKPRVYTTSQVLDLLRGVRENLEFSRGRSLALLHSYTAHHFDFFAFTVGIGGNRSLDLQALRDELLLVEAALDDDLLRRAGDDPEWLPLRFLMRKELDIMAGHNVARKAYLRARYLKSRIS